jgi:uncharacterized protein YdbL (DUF1318 family)
MTRKVKLAILLATGIVAVGFAAIATAEQTAAPAPPVSLVSAALAEGAIGEQADGYLGFRTTPSAALRAKVDKINIERRVAFTELAQQKNVTPKEVAVAVGCETLAKRVAVGRAYLLPDGVWRVRKANETIALPDYCGS